MSDKYFIDTNIFIYSFDKTNPAKMSKAQSIISQALEKNDGCISTQVIQEFANIASKKFTSPMKAKDLRIYMDEILFPLCSVFPSFELFDKSLEIHERYKFSFYDSMIVTAALISGSNILLSEDLKNKQKIDGVTILNPFIS